MKKRMPKGGNMSKIRKDFCTYDHSECPIPKDNRLDSCYFWSKYGCTHPTLDEEKQLEELKDAS